MEVVYTKSSTTIIRMRMRIREGGGSGLGPLVRMRTRKSCFLSGLENASLVVRNGVQHAAPKFVIAKAPCGSRYCDVSAGAHFALFDFTNTLFCKSTKCVYIIIFRV